MAREGVPLAYAGLGHPPAPPVPPACPDCSGCPWEVRDGELVRYVCRVGHAFSEDGALSANGANLERALWTAPRILAERAEFHRRPGDLARSRGLQELSRFHHERRRIAEHDAAALRTHVLQSLGREAGAE